MQKHRIIKFLLFLLLIGLIYFCSDSSPFEKDGIYFSVTQDGKGVTVTHKTTSYNSYAGDVVIPDKVTMNGNKYTVIGIDKYAFAYCEHLESVTIPESIISIGDMAFFGCPELSEIICMAERVPTTGVSVFAEDTKEKSTLYVPESSVGPYAETDCWNSFRQIKPIKTK